MTVRYRTTGPWGAGLGANLTPAQVDENFFSLKTIVDGFVAPVGVGITTIEVVGINMTIHLTDGSTQGPFQIPYMTFNMRGDWEPDTDYHTMDLFVISDGPQPGLYLVLLDYHSEATSGAFDPNGMDTDGNPFLQYVLPLAGSSSVLSIAEDASGNWFVDGTDLGKYIRLSGATTVGDYVVTIPVDVTGSSIADGFWATFRQVTDSQLSFEGDGTDDIITPPSGFVARSRARGATVTIVYVSAAVGWELSGDLEAV